jgi:hypothetical protein
VAPDRLPVRAPAELRKNIAFLVVSHDGYRDLWKPYFELFRRFWPDCPLQVSLLSNQLNPQSPGVESLRVGPDVSWSDNLRAALERIEQPYLVLAIEDQFFVERVNAALVNAVLTWVLDHQPNYLRLLPIPPADGPYDDLVGVVARGTVYRASTVYCVWKKTALQSLLRTGESPWGFEINAGERSDALDGFYAAREPCFPVSHGVVLGRWVRSEVRKLRRLGVEIDTVSRPMMTRTQAAIFQLRMLRSRLFRSLVPIGWSRAVRSRLQGC